MFVKNYCKKSRCRTIALRYRKHCYPKNSPWIAISLTFDTIMQILRFLYNYMLDSIVPTIFYLMKVTICTKWYCVPTNVPLIMSMEQGVWFYLCLDFCTLHSRQHFHSIQNVYIASVCKICTFCPVQGTLCKANVQGTLCKAHCACKAMPLIIWKGRDCTALAPAPDWPTSISGMHKWLTGGWFAFGLLPCTGGQVTVGN